MGEENTNKTDYLEKIFKAIEEANQEMKKYGVELSWSFKIMPYFPMETRKIE
jgi:hypothetical protein